MSTLLLFPKNQLLDILILCILLFVSISLIYALIFVIPFCRQALGLGCSRFSKFLSYNVKSFSCAIFVGT